MTEETEAPLRPGWESRRVRERVTWAGDIARGGEEGDEAPHSSLGETAASPVVAATGTLASLLEDDAPDFEEVRHWHHCPVFATPTY